MRHLKRYNQLFENQRELSQEQRDWLDKCSKGSWKLNPKTGLVDVTGDFDCSKQDLDSFKGVRFGTVGRSFGCSRNSLTSLEGAPQSVGGYFSCTNNRLTSLEGAPHKVGGGFNCSDNMLTSLEGAPQSVGGGFHCYRNSLTSLEGAPQRVGRDFYCSDNPISERTIKGVLKRMSDKRISLEEAVESYWKSIPKEDRLYLAKHHPSLPEEDKRGYEAIAKFRGKII